MQNDALIEAHYTRHHLFETILDRLKKAGRDIDRLAAKDLAGVDEFHAGGYELTREMAEEACVSRNSRVLDVGCGLGGACRMLADSYDCIVTGIDITAEYIRTAARLSELVGLQGNTRFLVGSALDLPFEDAGFDIVWTQHTQMNIENKQRMYKEIARVLVRGGRFIYYEIFSSGHEEPHYPLPWASQSSLSHLITRGRHRELLQEAGLTVKHSVDKTTKNIYLFENFFDRAKSSGLPAVGLHLLMGDDYMERTGNLYKSLKEGKINLEWGIASLETK